MPTSLCEMIHKSGLPPEGMALHIEAVPQFRHTIEAKPLISPVNADSGTRREARRVVSW